MYDVNTFAVMLRVHDALVRISRTIRDRRRRANESATDEQWWPTLNRTLHESYVAPLLDELSGFNQEKGYASDIVRRTLEEVSAFLAQANPRLPPPPIKNDLQLVEEYLQPAFEILHEKIVRQPNDPDQTAILGEITQYTFRDWFKKDRGGELIHHLASLVRSEPRSVPHEHLTGDKSLFGMPGVIVELSPEDADAWGAVTEDAISEEDAWESQADMAEYPTASAVNGQLGWYTCDTEAKSILFSVSAIQQRLKGRRIPKVVVKASPKAYFCELCDELTEFMSQNSDSSRPANLATRFCKNHLDVKSRRTCISDVAFDWLYSTILREASEQQEYRERLLGSGPEMKETAELLDHLSSCDFCSGTGYRSDCRVAATAHFSALMAYHANARRIAYKLAASDNVSFAAELDRAVQAGKKLRGFVGKLRTAKALGQNSEIALARLIHQKSTGVEIASRLGISSSAVSQRRSRLRGSFDFDVYRHPSLIWWPFDDIAGPNVARFPSRAMGNEWRHAQSEYSHLVSSRTKRPENLLPLAEFV